MKLIEWKQFQIQRKTNKDQSKSSEKMVFFTCRGMQLLPFTNRNLLTAGAEVNWHRKFQHVDAIHCEKAHHAVKCVFPGEQWSARWQLSWLTGQMLAPPTDARDFLPRNTEYYLQHENILPTVHSNSVPKLHGNLQKKSAFGESVHEAKETILVNNHVT